MYFDRSRPERLRLELTPPPLLYRAFGGDIDALVHHMKRSAEMGIRALRTARKRPTQGARRVRQIHPWDEPRSLRESGGQPVPTFRIGTRGIVGQLMDIDCATETRGFRDGYSDTRLARLAGDLDREYPYGTYDAVVHRGAPGAATPPAAAIVTAPGPLLCDVEAELAEDRALRAELRETAVVLVDDMREAFAEEAVDILEHTGVELSESVAVRVLEPATDPGAPSEDGATRPIVAVRHRFGERIDASSGAARVVVLRDKRRGRRSATNKHGADPPG